jgi:fucose permease
MIDHGLKWYTFYYTLVGGAVVELVSCSLLFWPENAARFRANTPKLPGSGKDSRTMEAVKSKVTWVLAFFLFAYMGVEGALSPSNELTYTDLTGLCSINWWLDRRVHDASP